MPGGAPGDRHAASLRLGIGTAVAVAGTLLHDLVEFGRPAVENSGVVAIVLRGGAFVWAVLPIQRRIVRGSTRAPRCRYAMMASAGSSLHEAVTNAPPTREVP